MREARENENHLLELMNNNRDSDELFDRELSIICFEIRFLPNKLLAKPGVSLFHVKIDLSSRWFFLYISDYISDRLLVTL